MLTHRLRLASSLLVLLAACGGGEGSTVRDAAPARAAPATPNVEPTTVLQVDGDIARIYRDGFGTPHVFAATNRALFVAYGWAVAEDRLFQLEMNRRAARGRLAELFGSAYVQADQYARTTGYTDAELDGMFAAMSGEEQAIYEAYGDGINRYVDEVVAHDLSKLPFEFAALGAFPQPWTIRDSIAFGAFMVRRFGEIGGSELSNLAVLQKLVALNGEAAGREIFDDVHWLDDPDAPVTIPTQPFGPRQKPAPAALARGPVAVDDLDAAKELWAPLGVPTKLGSYAWVVSAARSAEGKALLYGGPQMGFSAPEVVHEVQLSGGNGFDTIGMAFAGAPAILIGRNAHVAWTSTTATGDNVDVYAETPCDAGAGAGSGYLFQGACRAFERRVETIAVRGAAPVELPVLRSDHGPVVSSGGGFLFTQKRAHWLRELETGSAFFGFDRARNLNQFEAAVAKVVTSHNFLYADELGNIAYWQAGKVPVRPAGTDPRLPLPGDGSAEWPGALVPMPRSVNPAQGWLSNWNNKPAPFYPPADSSLFGKQGRLREIAAWFEPGTPISLEDMHAIPKDIARVTGNGRDARFLRPYLLAALDAVPPQHPLAGAAREVVEAWSENVFEDAVSSTEVDAGYVIFDAWLSRTLANAFQGALGDALGQATPNMLLHALDFAATGASGVPPTAMRDYFGAEGWEGVLSRSFDEVVAALAANAGGAPPAAWTAPRPTTQFKHPVVGVVGTIPTSNRSTYGQIVVTAPPHLVGWSIFTLGQSGFIGVAPPPVGYALDPHFADQLPLYRRFEYKDQLLWKDPADAD